RTIRLPAHIVAELRTHWRQQHEQRLALGMGKAPATSTVLANDEGKPLNPGSVTKMWARTVRKLGMPEAGLHSVRHTNASVLIANGVDCLPVSRRRGHANPSIPLNVYGHWVAGSDDRAADVIEAAFGGEMRPAVSAT